jgi:DNA-binding NarL/FixJ family response regulator
MPKHHIKSALVVASSHTLARLDRDCLKQAGVSRVRILQDGQQALQTVLAEPADIIVCDEKLRDMPGLEFIGILESVVLGKRPPVIMAGLDAKENAVLKAVAAGSLGYLIRPYSPERLGAYLALAHKTMEKDPMRRALVQRAKELAKTDKPKAAETAFKKIVEKKPLAEQWFEMGCRHLSRRAYEQAVLAFANALTEEADYADAYVGMAKAYKKMGEWAKYRESMLQAAECCVRIKKMARIRKLFADVVQTIPKDADPYMELGFRLVRKGDFEAAAGIYQQALSETVTEKDIYAAMARAGHFTHVPETSAEKLAKHYAACSGQQYDEVFKRIMGSPQWAAEGKPVVVRGNKPIHRITDMWEVAKYTYKSFRKNERLQA